LRPTCLPAPAATLRHRGARAVRWGAASAALRAGEAIGPIGGIGLALGRLAVRFGLA
jgi:hypothetical protein